MTSRVNSFPRSPSFWLAIFVSLLFGAMSLTGRYDLAPNIDLTWDTMNAWHLVHEGRVPLHGSVSSLYSLNTPGIAYGIAPGLVLFPHHPVAAECFGAAAFVVYAAGLYWFLEIAPAIFVLPVLWLFFRTPFKIRHLAVAALAKLVRAEGKNEAFIGYDMNQIDWLPVTRRADGVGKCGMPWDVALFVAYSITNLDTNAEGLSPRDEFRVYSPDYDAKPTDLAHLRWSMTLDDSLPPMDKVAEAGGYEILRRCAGK
jgi:hypothetical protein